MNPVYVSDHVLREDGAGEQMLRHVASLTKADQTPALEAVLLRTLTSTQDTRLRNVTALALAAFGTARAIPPMISLLSDPKTFGSRATLLYALGQMNVILPLSVLATLIAHDSPETQEEALILLERTLEGGVNEEALSSALMILSGGIKIAHDGERAHVMRSALRACQRFSSGSY